LDTETVVFPTFLFNNTKDGRATIFPCLVTTIQ